MGSHSKNSPLNRQSRAEHLDKLLDDALGQTFPASDPVAIAPARWRDQAGFRRRQIVGDTFVQSIFCGWYVTC
jgi:hypothetical protein